MVEVTRCAVVRLLNAKGELRNHETTFTEVGPDEPRRFHTLRPACGTDDADNDAEAIEYDFWNQYGDVASRVYAAYFPAATGDGDSTDEEIDRLDASASASTPLSATGEMTPRPSWTPMSTCHGIVSIVHDLVKGS
jgi:hypothetical protein